jgi:lipopolysaccharide/colanic/teichoic acid biosynthesis glycosyltransferase
MRGELLKSETRSPTFAQGPDLRLRHRTPTLRRAVAQPRRPEGAFVGDSLLTAAQLRRLAKLLGEEASALAPMFLVAAPVLPVRARLDDTTLRRIGEVVAAAVILVFVAPLLMICAGAIRLESPGAVVFCQTRRGRGEAEFTLLKLRTMRRDAEAHLASVKAHNVYARRWADDRLFKGVHDPRVTRVGRVLRRLHVDELPQLANVIRGEMRVVGPRPLELHEDRHVVGWAEQRRAVPPGLTGLWQVLGGNELPFDAMLRLDVLYVERRHLGLDLRLLLATPSAVLARHTCA